MENPKWNFWKSTNAHVQLSKDGLNAMNTDNHWEYVFAVQGFGIGIWANSRKERPILYYFEVTKMPSSYG
jgi:hypothetical protein